MRKALILSLAVCFGGTYLAAQQVGCLATNSSLVGSYTFIATQLPLSGVTINPPGSTNLYSNTVIGNLVGDVTSGTPFSAANVLYFDGNGHILVASSSAPLYPSTIVGAYTVNNDCTVNVTLTDVFNTATAGAGVTTPINSSINLIGLVLGGGTEVDLSVAQSSTSTNGNMPVVSGQFDSRLMVQLIRSFSYGCSTATLTGSYGLIGTGIATESPTAPTGAAPVNTGTTQPVVFFASVTFDGNGNVVAQTASPSSSPLANFNYAGTYTMNLNCSGTMTIKSSTPATATGTTSSTSATSLTINFVAIPTVAYAANGSANVTGNADRPSLLFSTENSTETIFGFGRAQ